MASKRWINIYTRDLVKLIRMLMPCLVYQLILGHLVTKISVPKVLDKDGEKNSLAEGQMNDETSHRVFEEGKFTRR